LKGAFDFDGNLSAIEAKIVAVHPRSTTYDDEEPF
jgi:hypothetical protein